jgi:hypothetical protein
VSSENIITKVKPPQTRLKPLQYLNLLRHEPGNISFKGSPIDDTFRTDVIIRDKILML